MGGGLHTLLRSRVLPSSLKLAASAGFHRALVQAHFLYFGMLRTTRNVCQTCESAVRTVTMGVLGAALNVEVCELNQKSAAFARQKGEGRGMLLCSWNRARRGTADALKSFPRLELL